MDVKPADLFLALIHYPVLDRNGRIVTSAITSLDLHDIARSAHTYGVRAAYIVHPIREQREFARSVIDHWRFDFGRTFDSRRREALETIEIVETLDDAIRAAAETGGARPIMVHTSARNRGGIDPSKLRARIEDDNASPMMLLFGTGFGLAPEVLERADLAMNAIRGLGEYNHLSVRAAVSIVLDRLRGR